MTLRRLPGICSFIFPSTLYNGVSVIATGTAGGASSLASAGTIDAAGEKVAFIGNVIWAGGAASKTMDSTSKIHFRTATVTMANAGTTIRIGLQDVATASGPPIQPDGTFDVYAEFAGNAGIISSSDDNVAKSVTLSTSGSKTLTNGQLVAVVFDMVARGDASDTLQISGQVGSTGGSGGFIFMPVAMQYTTSWQNPSSTAAFPNVMFESSDGTLGTLNFCGYYGPGSAYTYASTSTPDERALIFRVPFRCKVNGAFALTGITAAAQDFDIVLYSDPLGTPTALETITWYGEQGNNLTDERTNYFTFTGEHELNPGTDYAVAMKATGSTNCNLGYVTIASADHREINGISNCQGGSRSDATGAFGSLSTTDIPAMGVSICALDDGAPMPAYALGI